jgi:hypothetical protein
MKRKPVLLAVLLLLLLVFTAWRVLLMFDVNRRIARIRAEGLPAGGDELDRWYQTVPPEKNAALVLTNAISLLKRFPDEGQQRKAWDFRVPEPPEKLSTEQSEFLQSYVSLNEAAMARAEEALKLPDSRYPIDLTFGYETFLPHLADLHTLVQLNQFQSMLAADRRNLADAGHSIETILGMARTLEHEPALISQLVRLKFVSIATDALEYRLNAGGMTSEEIVSLRPAFECAVPTNCIALAFIGERAMICAGFQLTKERAARIDPTSKKLEPKRSSGMFRNRSLGVRILGLDDLDFGQLLTGLESGIMLAEMPPPDNLRIVPYFDRIGTNARTRFRPMSATYFPSVGGAIVSETEAAACHTMALTSLALEAFRNARGKFPDSLEDLTPDFLNEVPEDPFLRSKDLKYKRTGKGYVLYSVGRDQIDDGGLRKSETKNSPDKRSYDLVFTVER